MDRSGVNQTAQKESNLSLIIRLMRKNKECTRVWLAQETGLTQASVGKLIAQLMDWGMVSEREGISTGMGRRPVRLELNSGSYRVIAIRVNRDYISGGVFDMEGGRYGHRSCSINSVEGARSSMDRLLGMVGELAGDSDVPPMSIGVAVPGPFNYRTGRVSMMSGFPGWEEIDIKAELETKFGLETFVEQDANCGALAETRYGGYPDDCNMLYVVADRGIGAGLIINGSIYRGSLGFAGEIGHSSINVFGPRCECGNVGCLELYGSTVAMQSAYIQQVFDPQNPISAVSEVSASKILELVRSGDPTACGVYAKTVAYLAFGVVGIINMFNPSIVVFADKLTTGGELFLKTAKNTLKKYLMKELYDSIEVKTSFPSEDPMLFGASVAAFDHLIQMPTHSFKR